MTLIDLESEAAIADARGMIERTRNEGRAAIEKLRAGMAYELKRLDEAGTQLLDIAQNLAIVTADITRSRARLRGHIQAALLQTEERT